MATHDPTELDLAFARTLAWSRRRRLEAVLMMEPSQNRSCHNSCVAQDDGKLLGCWQLSVVFWKYEAEASVWGAAILVDGPHAQNALKVVSTERNQEFEALATETAEQTSTESVEVVVPDNS